MAATWIKPVHINHALGAGQTFKDTINYVINPQKTAGGEFITGYECEPQEAAETFLETKQDYQLLTKREVGENEIIAYHVRQAFKPGEVDAETANKLGIELAMELTNGKNAFIVATHTDKNHVHNHIIINAVNLDCKRKYRNPIRSNKILRKLSDKICDEHGLSIIENPGFGKGYNMRYKTPTKRDGLAGVIDDVLENAKPKDFEEFLKQLAQAGCKVKKRGKTISIQPPGAERFFKLKSGKKGLPEGYDEESLRKKIADMQEELLADIPVDLQDSIDDNLTGEYTKTTAATDAPPIEKTAGPISTEPLKQIHGKKFNLIIDLEKSIKAQENTGYERWAKTFNLQQAAETLLFLQTNNLTDMDTLIGHVSETKSKCDSLSSRIEDMDTRMKYISTLQKYIGAYNKSRDVYSAYLSSGRNSKFRAENEKAIATCEEAKAYFDSLGVDTLPTIKQLQTEYAGLISDKQKCRDELAKLRQQHRELQTAKSNIDVILGNEQHERENIIAREKGHSI